MIENPNDGATTRVRPVTLIELVGAVNDAVTSLAELAPHDARAELVTIAAGMRAELLSRGVAEHEALAASYQFAATVAEQVALARIADD